MAPLLRTGNNVVHVDDALNSESRWRVLESSTGRRVRFESSQPKILNLENEYLSHEDLSRMWWTADELIAIRNKAKMFSLHLRNDGASQDCHLTTAHHKITLFLASRFRSLLKLPPSSPYQDLSKWCSYNDGRRGLERYVSSVYSSFRQRDVVYTRIAVLTEQARQRDQHINCPDMIAATSQLASIRARTFAFLLASADASVTMKAGTELRTRTSSRDGKPFPLKCHDELSASECFQRLVV